MSPQSTVLQWDLIRSIASSTVSGTYAAVGTAFTYPVRLLKIVNNSTEDVSISVDGANTVDYIPAGGFTLYDCGTNRGNPSPSLEIRQGTQIFVSGTAGTGNIYVVTLYAFNSQNAETQE